jgi:hypothetical protein
LSAAPSSCTTQTAAASARTCTCTCTCRHRPVRQALTTASEARGNGCNVYTGQVVASLPSPLHLLSAASPVHGAGVKEVDASSKRSVHGVDHGLLISLLRAVCCAWRGAQAAAATHGGNARRVWWRRSLRCTRTHPRTHAQPTSSCALTPYECPSGEQPMPSTAACMPVRPRGTRGSGPCHVADMRRAVSPRGGVRCAGACCVWRSSLGPCNARTAQRLVLGNPMRGCF